MNDVLLPQAKTSGQNWTGLQQLYIIPICEEATETHSSLWPQAQFCPGVGAGCHPQESSESKSWHRHLMTLLVVYEHPEEYRLQRTISGTMRLLTSVKEPLGLAFPSLSGAEEKRN